MMSLRSVGPWLRSASYVALVGCAGTDNATIGDVTGVARPFAPESLGRVTSQRPTFRWVLPADARGVRLQVCRDRPCRDLLQTTDVDGESFRPASSLPPGVYFWRALARRGTLVSSKPAPVWEFVVGARDRGTDTVLDRIPDYNGDGYADLALRFDEQRPVGVYLGGVGGLGRAPGLRLALTAGDGVRASFSPVGDLDGDGFPEALSVATRADDPAQRAVYLYHGGPAGLSSTPEQLTALGGAEHWPDSFSSAGDLNGDGYSDVVGLDRERGATPGRVRVFFGAARGLQAAPAVFLQGQPGDGMGTSVSGSGDVNGDGRPDLLVGLPSVADPGVALVWLNRAGVGLHDETTRLQGDPNGASLFGNALSLVGDFNGDGYGDPLVAEPYAAAVSGRSRVMLFQGARSGVSTAPARTVPFGGAQIEAMRLRAGGDFNGDGYDDAVAWMHNEMRGPSLSLFYGSPEGLPGAPSRVVYATDLGSAETALSFAWTGDSDRDGYDDLVLALQPTEWMWLRGSSEGLRVVDGPRLELP